jgi:hypothetical protein
LASSAFIAIIIDRISPAAAASGTIHALQGKIIAMINVIIRRYLELNLKLMDYITE